MFGISKVAEQLLASQKELGCLELVGPHLHWRIGKNAKILIRESRSRCVHLNPRPSACKVECCPLDSSFSYSVRICVLCRRIASLSIRTVNTARSQFAISALVFSSRSSPGQFLNPDVCLFFYFSGLFNRLVSDVDCAVSNDCVIVNSELERMWLGGKRSWLNLRHFLGMCLPRKHRKASVRMVGDSAEIGIAHLPHASRKRFLLSQLAPLFHRRLGL
jgi:hypothetical protein